MGYYVKKLPYISRSWKVIFQSRKGVRREHDIKEAEYLSLGFSPNMSLEEAKERCKTLNSSSKMAIIEENRKSIQYRLHYEDLKFSVNLPNLLVDKFTNLHIKTEKQRVCWRAVQKCILELNLKNPKEWYMYEPKFYEYFLSRRYSYSYVQKLLTILNKWGRLYCYEIQSYYTNIQLPKGHRKEQLNDSRTTTKESLPLTPSLLESKRSNLTIEHYNWLYISMWLGLRPLEVDNLHKARIDRGTTVVIWLYQTKLLGIPRDKRWKPIPLKYTEQMSILDILNSGNYKRPLNKTLKMVFGGQYTCYAGRKGFTDLMLEKGNNLEAISQWLGHQSIERTWKIYKNKKKVLF